ncbi:hypothetical protein BRADI_2g08045v3 [Brachypodium distachyon]|uniref:Uncharacterized protein n=1 Tax=Brachypodium distachyon TaxID=15368 RepID=A0A2K2D7G9_BRADI|nr:hypothetical protein BRADI_2g08045v3 [Brachypodium distachyon]
MEEVAEELGEGFAAYCRRGKGRNRQAASVTPGGCSPSSTPGVGGPPRRLLALASTMAVTQQWTAVPAADVRVPKSAAPRRPNIFCAPHPTILGAPLVFVGIDLNRADLAGFPSPTSPSSTSTPIASTRLGRGAPAAAGVGVGPAAVGEAGGRAEGGRAGGGEGGWGRRRPGGGEEGGVRG